MILISTSNQCHCSKYRPFNAIPYLDFETNEVVDLKSEYGRPPLSGVIENECEVVVKLPLEAKGIWS
jgi:hypothetical protein